jgi:hypothetical protein
MPFGVNVVKDGRLQSRGEIQDDDAAPQASK